jgi:hypothetical protein
MFFLMNSRAELTKSLCCDQRSELSVENIIRSYHHGPTRRERDNEKSTEKTGIDAFKLCTPSIQPIYHESSHVHAMQKENAHYSQKSFQNKSINNKKRPFAATCKTTKALFPKGISFPFVSVQLRRVSFVTCPSSHSIPCAT